MGLETTALFLGTMLLGGGAAYSISRYQRKQAKRSFQAGVQTGQGATPAPMPKAPKVSEAIEQAQIATTVRRRAMRRSKTVFTSPLGIGGEAEVIRKTLLGQ